MILLGNAQRVGPAIGRVVTPYQKRHIQNLLIREELLQFLNVSVTDGMRGKGQLLGEVKRDLLLERKRGPIGIECEQRFFRRAG
jgi:hypothetical protein